MQCKAKSKRSGERCRRQACKGKDVCANHGGKSPGAPLIHGERSKFKLPAGLQGLVERELNDPELLSHRQTVALLGGLLLQQTELIQEVPTPERLDRIVELAEAHSKQKDRETKRVTQLESMLTTQQATIFVLQTKKAVENVAKRLAEKYFPDDPAALSAITREIAIEFGRVVQGDALPGAGR